MKSKDQWRDLLNEVFAIREIEADGITCRTRVAATIVRPGISSTMAAKATD